MVLRGRWLLVSVAALLGAGAAPATAEIVYQRPMDTGGFLFSICDATETGSGSETVQGGERFSSVGEVVSLTGTARRVRSIVFVGDGAGAIADGYFTLYEWTNGSLGQVIWSEMRRNHSTGSIIGLQLDVVVPDQFAIQYSFAGLSAPAPAPIGVRRSFHAPTAGASLGMFVHQQGSFMFAGNGGLSLTITAEQVPDAPSALVLVIGGRTLLRRRR